MVISNKINVQQKEICINDIVFLYNDGKHLVESFTKTAIRFKSLYNGKIQTINKKTFLKKHFYTKQGFWKLEQKMKSVNMDYI